MQAKHSPSGMHATQPKKLGGYADRVVQHIVNDPELRDVFVEGIEEIRDEEDADHIADLEAIVAEADIRLELKRQRESGRSDFANAQTRKMADLPMPARATGERTLAR